MLTERVRNMIKAFRTEYAEQRLPIPPDFGPEEVEILNAVRSYTMTSPERIYSVIQAVQYVEKAGVPGAIVECGVWRGGSMMAMAYALKGCGRAERDLYLFDTFEGMTAPTGDDLHYSGESAFEKFGRRQLPGGGSDWCRAPVEEVKRNVLGTGYDERRVTFVKGPVEQTIPGAAPERIALLRLDTDWYESTRHELAQLYPRLSPGGVLIIDDYGHWRGSRKATDEYLAEQGITLLLGRIDYTGRIAVKPR